MAEVAGLVLGAVGVAGLIGAFKDAIDLFNNFADSRNFGRDYAILTTKIDIERTILLQWADHVNLLRPNYDRRLDEPRTQQAVNSSLACICQLMSEESELVHRYGLHHSSRRQDGDIDRAPTISGYRLEKFLLEFEALDLGARASKQPTPLKRVRWIVRDKEKFGSLVSELSHFTAKLDQLMPINHGHDTRIMTCEDVAAIGSIHELKLLLQASIGYQKGIADATQERLVCTYQDRILRLLWFRTIDDRRESIAAAHEKTFHWAFEPPTSRFPWYDLSKWLQYESGIYWISGKAGSGKSTLMKYIFQNEKTRSLLSRWADGAPYTLINHFFWNLGTTEQKSQEGLSRAFLYQILSSNKSLIPDVLPHMWKELYDGGDHVSLPSLAETKYAVQTLAARTADVARCCFFIDGLDEYVGNYSDGIAFITELSANQHIKIVVSSRPIPDCVASFKDLPSLQLHDLTRSDIASYVRDQVGSHQYMRGLISRYRQEATEIMQDVVNKSSGVFLWVVLACRSLISGFADYDLLPELRRLVDELPPELETMFQHMLRNINRRNREQGARLLRLCYATRQAQNDEEVGDMSLLALALADNEYVNRDQIKDLIPSNKQKLRLCDELNGRLRSRCGGLLEVQSGSGRFGRSSTAFCFCGYWRYGYVGHDALIDGTVVFMHRTVFEFLSDEKSWELDCLQAPEGFEVATDLSLVGLYGAIASDPDLTEQTEDFLHDGMHWGTQADRQDPERKSIFWVMQPFLDNLPLQAESDDTIFSRLAKMNHHDPGSTFSRATLLLAAETGAVNYVGQHPEFELLAKLRPGACGCFPLLYHATCQPLVRKKGSRCGFSNSAMVRLLLSHGSDPNQRIEYQDGTTRTTTSPWAAWLQHLANGSPLDDSDRLEVAETAMTLLNAGADILKGPRDWVEKVFLGRRSPLLKEKVQDLLRQIDSLNSNGSCNMNRKSLGESSCKVRSDNNGTTVKKRPMSTDRGRRKRIRRYYPLDDAAD